MDDRLEGIPSDTFYLSLSDEYHNTLVIRVTKESGWPRFMMMNADIEPKEPSIAAIEFIDIFFRDSIAKKTLNVNDIVVIIPIEMHFERNEKNASIYNRLMKKLVYDGKMKRIMFYSNHPVSRIPLVESF